VHSQRPILCGLQLSLMFSAVLGLALAGCDSRPTLQEPARKETGGVKYAPETKRAKQVVPQVVDVTALMQDRRCHLCHSESDQRLGPSYEQIRLAYRSRKDVMAEVLAHKIINGGGGNWGLAPMVPNEGVALEEARLMATWILGADSQ